MDDYAPDLATATPPVVSGGAYFFPTISFLSAMRWTTYTSTTYSYSEWTGGWTASTEGWLPIAGGVGYGHSLAGSTATGQLGVGPVAEGATSTRGVFLWRPAGLDYTSPVVTPVVSGTLGDNGWYRSNVGVSWTVTDPESPIVSTSGCGPSLVAVDTTNTSFTCTATSAGLGGPGSASVAVKRDATPPTIVCGATPTFTLTQFPRT